MRGRGPKIYSGNFVGAELCWASSLIFVGNDPSFTAFTDKGGGAELRPLDTTGVNAAKIQLEFIEFQQNVVAVKEIFLMTHLETSCQRKVSRISKIFSTPCKLSMEISHCVWVYLLLPEERIVHSIKLQ